MNSTRRGKRPRDFEQLVTTSSSSIARHRLGTYFTPLQTTSSVTKGKLILAKLCGLSCMSDQVDQPVQPDHNQEPEEVCLDCDPPVSQRQKSSVTLNIDLVSPSDLSNISFTAANTAAIDSTDTSNHQILEAATVLGPVNIPPPSEPGERPKILIQFCDRCRW